MDINERLSNSVSDVLNVELDGSLWLDALNLSLGGDWLSGLVGLALELVVDPHSVEEC